MDDDDDDDDDDEQVTYICCFQWSNNYFSSNLKGMYTPNTPLYAHLNAFAPLDVVHGLLEALDPIVQCCI